MLKIPKTWLFFGAAVAAPSIDYSDIAQRIWQNESGGNPEKLVFWNQKEEFPSLGIGHFIWYPKDFKGPFVQTFPAFLTFCKEKNAPMPSWLKLATHAPWSSRELFLSEKSGPRMLELRQFLIDTIDIQAQFMVERMQSLLKEVYDALPTAKQESVKNWIKLLSNSSQGLYVLVDYVNFKGAGTSSTERYDGFGWGLQQVFEEMNPQSQELADLLKSFADSAKKVLERRVSHAPTMRNEQQFLAGWIKRLSTYQVTA